MEAFEAIYRAYFRDVFLYLRQLCQGDDHLAEELTSQVFFQALKALDRFRGDCQVRVWLCQIARNCYVSHLRNHRHQVELTQEQLELVPEPGPTLEEVYDQQQQALAIRKALDGLVDPYRTVFQCRVLGQMSFRDIGKLFSKSENWACVTYHRARAKIKKELEE